MDRSNRCRGPTRTASGTIRTIPRGRAPCWTKPKVVQRQLREIGLDVRIQLIDGTAISSVWFAGDFDAMLHWWHMPPDPELTLFFAADRTPPAGRNINYVDDAAL